jgi:hypothetical protein
LKPPPSPSSITPYHQAGFGREVCWSQGQNANGFPTFPTNGVGPKPSFEFLAGGVVVVVVLALLTNLG